MDVSMSTTRPLELEMLELLGLPSLSEGVEILEQQHNTRGSFSA